MESSQLMNGMLFDKPVSVTGSDGRTGQECTLTLTPIKAIGHGSFGLVYLARIGDNESVAVKKVLQDRRYKNRELDIMKLLNHPNVVKLLYYFYNKGERNDELFLNLVLEYVPETIYRATRHYAKNRQYMSLTLVKLYMYQMLRSLAYIHFLGICHRDIKPQNLLLDPVSGILKLCDFGSAKMLVPGEPNVSYICSRYYRAPELIFGATNYTTAIDVWSTGCVMAELILNQPIFPGESGVDQLVEIIKILGTPTRQQILAMNPNYTEFKFPMIKSQPWPRVLRSKSAETIDLISKLLDYTPQTRIDPISALAHPFFNELRDPNTRLPNGKPLPPLFDFTEQELSVKPELNRIIIPPHAEAELSKRVNLQQFLSGVQLSQTQITATIE